MKIASMKIHLRAGPSSADRSADRQLGCARDIDLNSCTISNSERSRNGSGFEGSFF